MGTIVDVPGLGQRRIAHVDIRGMSATTADEGGLDYQAMLGQTSKKMSDRYIKRLRTINASPRASAADVPPEERRCAPGSYLRYDNNAAKQAIARMMD